MVNKMIKYTFMVAMGLVLSCQLSIAGVTPDEAKKLKTTLTPFGAERAGNTDGTIPAWEGGIAVPPSGYKSGDLRPNPFKDEKKLYSIDASNMDKYADRLTEGTKSLMKKYPDYRIDVYPTHRTGAAPQWVYDATYENATRANLIVDSYSIEGAYQGIPFPIPQNGLEVIFNHLCRWEGTAFDMKFRNYIVTSSGKATLAVEALDSVQYPYYYQNVPYEKRSKIYYMLRQMQTAPPFKAGESLLLWDPVNMAKDGGRKAWQYLTGQRRVRRAPAIAYDTPDFVSSGMNYFDEVYVLLGAPDKYNWTLIGKKEMYIPYNCYDYYSRKDEEVIGVGKAFLNPNHVRWELHRVWVTEGKLREDKRHVVQKRRYYLDEDSWVAVMYDGWDGKGQLWRHTISLPINIFEVPCIKGITWGVHNLQTGARTVSDQVNEVEYQYKKLDPRPQSYFSPDALAGSGIR